MNAKFLFTTEFSVIGTQESAIYGIKIEGRKIPFTGDVAEVLHFGITAEELAKFAGEAQSVHFEREVLHVPVCGTSLNDNVAMQEIFVLTVRAIANGEAIKTTQISRVVSYW